jgi:lipopolysaccharide/colanic/teichoic acid biosynthesis glycosyltransferase
MLQTHANTHELPADEVRHNLNRSVALQSSTRVRPSAWSVSAVKRVFDCACVLLALPMLLPLALAVAAAVRFTSPGPVLFLQKRAGRHGRVFTIFKFRTMIHFGIHAGTQAGNGHHPITTQDNQRFTPSGPFLRRWKLDELPQLLNVLLGDMSLVGPRPKMPEHAIHDLLCRPGLTGMATLAFAEEEAILARVPAEQLDDCFYKVVLPAKRQIDAQYMECATLSTDLRLLVKSVLRRWETPTAEELIGVAASGAERNKLEAAVRVPVEHRPVYLADDRPRYSLGYKSPSPAVLQAGDSQG